MKINLLSILLSLTLYTTAQYNQQRCGTFDLMKYREELNPGYINTVKQAFNTAHDIAQSNSYSRDAYDTIYRIRCVVHVVYQNADQNLDDSVILSQMEVLNEDYRRLNDDTFRTRSIFKPLAADARIEFVLADTDPDGNPTTGITRTQGSPQGIFGFSPFDDNVKSATLGGKNPWPTDRYLNIWVCSVLNGFGVLGYAFPPSNAPNWPNGSSTDSAKQGVVLHYSAVGRNNPDPIDPTVERGRSAVHEIGHYLGLRHIWGDGDCTEDDGISDTPDADAASQQTCDTTSNTCSEAGPVQYPDMIENYMDYSDDRCLNMFTMEQVGIMRAMLQTSRAGIADRVVSTSVASLNWDAAVNIYPNPAKDMLQISLPKNATGEATVEVFNSLGCLQATEQTAKHQFSMNFSSFSAGVYFIKVSNGRETTVKRVIKN